MTEKSHIFSVSALTASLKAHIEGSFPYVWVRGQISNLARPSSGHLYFSLRDENAMLAAVWFKNRQKDGEAFDPLTGEVFENGPRPCLAASMKDGQEIICAGPLQLYSARGQYQLIVEIAQDAGLGLLHEQFEQLRRKLAGLGYFALERKRPAPVNPARVAVITAPGGAAIQDFLRIAQGRGLGSHIRIFPAPVQGDGAAARIRRNMQRIADEGWAQVLVLIRGGGSIEDLWAFNDEALAGSIFNFPLPVLAGIGHEVDFTLADMTADLRAATPTHAAQLLWPERESFFRQLRQLTDALKKNSASALERIGLRLEAGERDLAWRAPLRRLDRLRERLDATLQRLYGAGRFILEQRLARLQSRETALTPARAGLPARYERLKALAQRLEPAPLRGLESAAARLLRLCRELPRNPALRVERERQRLLVLARELTRSPLRHALAKKEELERSEKELA
ncbi:exodeoxyribonuclease VII large subunit, partial [Desulfovibrio sp. OttesenSCG-928-A18]|nr:exodeoxyribonuclease VII large subunit [Desulfovibrio sp. OttesenSCG-928-A18]